MLYTGTYQLKLTGTISSSYSTYVSKDELITIVVYDSCEVAQMTAPVILNQTYDI